MLLPVLMFIGIGLAIGLVSISARVAGAASAIIAAVSWVLIARFTYLQPIPLNEPEWWGGLAIVAALVGIGVVVGSFMRRRQGARDPIGYRSDSSRAP